jgi:hypothetical protein
MPIGTQNQAAAASAITAIRPAFRHKFFPPKTDATATPVSCLCKNFDPIDKHCVFKLPLARRRVIPSKARDPAIEV